MLIDLTFHELVLIAASLEHSLDQGSRLEDIQGKHLLLHRIYQELQEIAENNSKSKKKNTEKSN